MAETTKLHKLNVFKRTIEIGYLYTERHSGAETQHE